MATKKEDPENSYMFTEENVKQDIEENDKTSDHILVGVKVEESVKSESKQNTNRTMKQIAEEFLERMYDDNINVEIESVFY